MTFPASRLSSQGLHKDSPALAHSNLTGKTGGLQNCRSTKPKVLIGLRGRTKKRQSHSTPREGFCAWNAEKLHIPLRGGLSFLSFPPNPNPDTARGHLPTKPHKDVTARL
jgi:hypothetical protein